MRAERKVISKCSRKGEVVTEGEVSPDGKARRTAY